jgi:hypothetical protein
MLISMMSARREPAPAKSLDLSPMIRYLADIVVKEIASDSELDG